MFRNRGMMGNVEGEPVVTLMGHKGVCVTVPGPNGHILNPRRQAHRCDT